MSSLRLLRRLNSSNLLSRQFCSAQTSPSMASNKFKLGLCQFLVGDDKDVNLQTAAKAITDASEQGADIIVLPEIFNSPYSTASFPVYCEPVPDLYTIGAQIDAKKSPSSYMLSNAAKTHKKYIIGGSIPEETYENDTRKLYNTCLVFDTDGNVIGKYRKMHLFDVNIIDKMRFCESETLTGGSDICMVKIEGVTKHAFNIGIGICYDIRFSELAEIYRQHKCSLLVYPAAFNTTTGPLHWQLLQRARAIDNQLFVASCSPARNHHSKGYPVYGHSIITDPWGQVLSELDESPGILMHEIDLDAVDQVRASIPIWKQKRYDMYSQITCKL